jgi:enterochelin esterase-like enzyme
VVGLLAVASTAGAARREPSFLPTGWTKVQVGPAGGTVWKGDFSDIAPFGWSFTPSFVYLPPNYSTANRYPVLYFLHGFPGAPSSIVDSLALGTAADTMIQDGQIRPFIAVVPSANGLTLDHGEWTGDREAFITDDIISWVDTNLPSIPTRAGRVIAGLSAGAYGAVDITLRHPELFKTAESWSGYFKPIPDGSLHHASAVVLAAHNPSKLARKEAALLRRLGTRFYLSCGSTKDRKNASFSHAFSLELKGLGIAHELALRPGAHNGKFWRAQLPTALMYAFAPANAN